MNNNENYEFFECSNCSRDDCTYTLCSVLPKVKSHNETHDTLNKQINFLNKLIDGQNVSEQQINALGNSKYAQMIKNLMSVAGKESSEEHKKIKFIGKPKIFSIISAERFEKICFLASPLIPFIANVKSILSTSLITLCNSLSSIT